MVVLLTIIGYFASLTTGADQADAGGVRQVRASVKTVGDDYVIQVRFLAVCCFDKATNQEMNIGLGRSFALEALARHLSEKKKVELLISGARTADNWQDGKMFSLTIKVPQAGAKVIDAQEVSRVGKSEEHDAEKVELADEDASITSRKAIYEKMIIQLVQLLRKEWKRLRAEVAPGAPPADRLDAFRKKLSASFDQLAGEIQGDLELTNLGSDLDPDSKGEKDQLLASLKGERERLLRELNR